MATLQHIETISKPTSTSAPMAAQPPAGAGYPPAAPTYPPAQPAMPMQPAIGFGPGHQFAPSGPPQFLDMHQMEAARKKIRKASIANLIGTLIQLSASVAIICIVKYDLSSLTVSGKSGGSWSYTCYMGPPAQMGACEYAYSLASISIFWCFILSLMQCLTLDCCGMGRLVETMFDGLAAAWWIAGGATLSSLDEKAENAGVPKDAYRDAVVALAWVSAAMFMLLMAANAFLTITIGKAYRQVAQQQAAAMVAGGGAHVIQMTPGAAPAGYPGGAPGGAGYPAAAPAGMPPGYPPVAAAPGGYPAAAAAPGGYPPAPSAAYAPAASAAYPPAPAAAAVPGAYPPAAPAAAPVPSGFPPPS